MGSRASVSATSPSPHTRVSAAIASAFRDEGVREVFGLLGNGNMEFVAYFVDAPGCTYRPVRHENAAVAAAEGYARMSGAVGVATCTMGPGITHAATGLITAARGATPLVVFTGSAQRGVHAIDERAFVEACDCMWVPFQRIGDVADAFYAARTQRVPVVLGAALEVQERDAQPVPYKPRPVPRRPRMLPDPADVEAAADLLASASHPVILAGRGALGATEQLVEVADLLDAPIATTLPVKGDFGGARRAIGTMGGYASDAVIRSFERADCVLAVGTSLSTNTTRRETMFDAARIIHVDLAAGRRPVHLPIVADAGAALEALADALEQRGHTRRTGAVSADDSLAEEMTAHTPSIEPDALDPRMVAVAIDRAIPDDAVIVTDSGHFHAFVCSYIGPGDARRFEIQNEFGAVGLGLGRAIGAAIAAPDRTVVCVTGDGGLMQSIAELDTAARSCPNLVIVVMNDGALGAEYHKLTSKGLDADLAVQPTPDLVVTAEAAGVAGRRGDSVASVESALRELCGLGRAGLVDIPVSRNVVSRHYRDIVFHTR